MGYSFIQNYTVFYKYCPNTTVTLLKWKLLEYTVL